MLRDFQIVLKRDIYAAWGDGAINVMPVLATGGGKTTVFCNIVRDINAPACIIAHRQELVGQAALALNRERVPHGIIAQKEVVQQIIRMEHETHGYSCFSSRAPVRAAGVDTIIRHDARDRWYSQVQLVVQDEGHHLLATNKWGKAQLMFPNARGLFPTAHAVRADRKGLGRGADGLVDQLCIGPHGRELIKRGHLTDYTLYCVGSDIEFKDEWITAAGDYSPSKIRAATHESNRLVGDVVAHYMRHASGKLGVTFAVDIESATELRRAYNAAGVPAEIITGKTPTSVRSALMRQFRARQILQLVSVDCLGEGVDVPAIEVVSLARRTASWQLMCQQIGRALRVMVADEHAQRWNDYSDDERLAIIATSRKPKAIIFDHVGNILWHAQHRGLPDSAQQYSLLRGESGARGKSDAIPLRACLACFMPFPRFRTTCEHCGAPVVPAGRSSPEQVEGDLIELDESVLAALRGELQKIDGPVRMPANVDAAAQRGILRNHHDRARAQQSLRHVLQVWGGWQKHRGLADRESQKLFFIRYGVDVLTAQALGATQAVGLELLVRGELEKNSVHEVTL